MSYRTLLVVSLSLLSIAGCSEASSPEVSADRPSSSEKLPTESEESHASSSDASSGKDAGSPTAPTPAGPVELKNLSISQTARGFSITFALVNQSPQAIERVQEVTVKAGSSRAVTYMVAACQSPNWFLEGGESSGVIELEISTYLEGSYLKYASGCAMQYGDPLHWTPSKAVALNLKGLLDDATPWEAHAKTSP